MQNHDHPQNLFLITAHYYTTISAASTSEYKDRGSKFLGFAYPLDSIFDFKTKLSELKKAHPKAAHHCFAYRLGTDKNVFRVSDDGEPSGSAGRPILGQIDSFGLTNIAVIIVRYFGGTLLGVSGLVNAYKSTASLALGAATKVTLPIRINCTISFDYNKINDVMHIIKMSGCLVRDQDLQLFCSMTLAVPLAGSEDFFLKLGELRIEVTQ